MDCLDEVIIGGVDEHDDYGVSLDVGPEGRAWVVWSGHDPVQEDSEVYYSMNDGSGWTGQTRLHGENSSADRFPVVSVGHDGVAFAVWARLQANGNRLWTSHWQGCQWSVPEIVMGGVSRYDDYDVYAIDSTDVWVARDGYAAGTDTDLIVTYHWNGEVWDGPWTVGPEGWSNEYPDFGMSPDGRPWLVWIAMYGGAAAGPVMYSPWTGEGWAIPEIANDDPGNAAYPQIVFDGNVPMVVWYNHVGNVDIRYCRREGGQWTPAGIVNLPDTPLDLDGYPSCDRDESGRIAVVWSISHTGDYFSHDVMASWWEGQGWTPELQLNGEAPNKNDAWASAALGPDGTLWAAWECYEEIAPPWDTDIRGTACVQTTPVSFGVLRAEEAERAIRVSWYASGEAEAGPFYVWRVSGDLASVEAGQGPAEGAAILNETPCCAPPYECTDRDVIPGGTYHYWAEWRRATTSDFLGPASARLGGPPGVVARVLSVRPNPSRSGSCFPHEQYREGVPELVIYTIAGREIARISPGKLAPGRYDDGARELCWGGRDRSGAEIPSGVYAWRLLFDGARVEGESGLVTVVK